MRRTTPAAERFASKVDRSAGPDGCWPWTAGQTAQGYGGFHSARGVLVLAHRYAWEEANGPIPEGAHVDHLCHNGTGCPPGPCPHRLCCNPAHLEPTTPVDNVDRSHNANQHKTHCPRGHAYDEGNTYRSPRGERRCRECARERDRARAPRRTDRRAA